MERTRKIVVTICVLLCLFVLAALDWRFGGLKFVNTQYDETISTFALCSPAACVILLGFLPRSSARLWGFVCGVPFAALCLLVALLDFNGGMFPDTVTRLSSTRLGYSTINAYYSNAGAMDDGDVFVQQEIKLLPGLLWVKPVLNQSITNTVKISVIDRHHIRCEYTAYLDPGIGAIPTSETKRDVVWVF